MATLSRWPMIAVTLLAALALQLWPRLTGALPTSGERLARLEKEELDFAKSSLMRELGGARSGGGGQAEENAIRRAHRKIALRYRQNIFSDTEKFEFQMRILNLARDALVRGEGLGGAGAGGAPGSAGAAEGEEGEGAEAGSGRELPPGSRMSEEILKNMHSWQEYALEEGVRFDGPEVPFFVGHTLHGFEKAFRGNWTHFVLNEVVEMWPATAQLRLHVELQGGADSSSPSQSGPERARLVSHTARRLARDALSSLAGALHECGARSPSLEGVLPESDDDAAWAALQLKTSRALRELLLSLAHSGGARPDQPCGALAGDRDARVALLELNLQALVHYEAEARGDAALAAELRAAHDAVAAARAEGSALHCREVAAQKRAALDRLWEDYQFGPLIMEVYPLDACSLDGLAAFLEFHGGVGGELLSRKGEPDRSVLRAVRGMLWLQQALVRPAALDSGQWREALVDLEGAVWQAVAFPELHDAAGKLMAELAVAGLMPAVLEAALEHPPVQGGTGPGGGEASRHGREAADAQPSKSRRFEGLNVPGYSLKSIEVYEASAIAMWGDESDEERWDPVRLGLGYLDLVPACEMPIQIAMCFLSASLWLWRALQLLGDKCGGDAWLETYIFEDLYSVPEEGKRLAMMFALKRAIFELVEYAALFAEHRLQPGARLAVHRTAYLTLHRVTRVFGTEEDAPRVLAQLRRSFASARLNPFWAPPVMQVADSVFADILGGRLHAAFLDGLREGTVAPAGAGAGAGGGQAWTALKTATVVPGAALEHCIYEGAIMGLGDLLVDPVSARFGAMGALLQSAGGRTWGGVEAVLGPPPLRVDVAGFAAGEQSRPASPAEDGREFSALRGIRIHMRTGDVSLLLARPFAERGPLLGHGDISEVLGIQDEQPLFLSLDAPTAGGGSLQYPQHPFQRAALGVAGAGRDLEYSLLHAALAVQQLAAGTEVAMRAPFATRPCGEGLCKFLPRAANAPVTPVAGVPGEPWDPAPRLFLECSNVPYAQRIEGETLEITFGEPVFDVHPGKPLAALDEEAFRTWPVAKLRKALQVLGEESEELPALEKHELVERLLRLTEGGKFLEDDDEASNPLARFSRRFRHHFQPIAERWPQFARLGALCAVRIASLVLRTQLQQMNASAEAQASEVKANAEAHAQGMKDAQSEHWFQVLAEVHAHVLRELGFVDLDPGQCFADGARSFARCCSVGDHAAACWNPRDAAAEERRCCGAAARRGEAIAAELVVPVAAQLGSSSPRRPPPEVLVPAVQGWLRDPTGVNEEGIPLSAVLVDLLAEEVSGDEMVQRTQEQLRRPVDAFSAALTALPPPAVHAMLDTASATDSRSEAWVPVPPVASSGNRRVLYTTVVLAPQLREVSAGELEHFADAGEIVEEVSLQDLARHAADAASVASGSGTDSSSALDGASARAAAELEVLQEASLLLSRLDARADDVAADALEDAAATARAAKAAGAAASVEAVLAAVAQAPCAADGWRELPAEAAASPHAVAAGQRVRTRRRMSEDVNGEVGVMRAVLTLTGQPGEHVTVWEVLPSDGGPAQFLDFRDETLVVAVPCDEADVARAEDAGGEADGSDAWPNCIEANVAFPSADGAGVFVNLGALDISEGCFLGDCSRSDHFACGSPAECALTCAKVPACRWWTFQELAPPTCWLRGDGVRTREEVRGSSSGAVSCVPPPEPPAPPREASLFEVVAGASGVPPADLWGDRDLLQALEVFGNYTVAELKLARPSEVQRGALRLAARAASRCAETWRGCFDGRAPVRI